MHVADFDLFAQVAHATHLIPHPGHTHAWHRHPFAFLVEAADDIAYRVIDIEDGYRVGHLTYTTAAEALSALLPAQDPAKNRLQQIREPKDRIEFLRAKAISTLTQQAADCFLDQADLILRGQLDQPLCDQLDCRVQLDELLKLARKHIYCAPEVVEIQAAGFRVIGDLLDYFLPVIDDVARQGDQASAHSRMLIQLIPTQFILPQNDPAATPYTRLLHLTDFISGMTDSYAVTLYKKVTGIALPAG
jgi:dGTPase